MSVETNFGSARTGRQRCFWAKLIISFSFAPATKCDHECDREFSPNFHVVTFFSHYKQFSVACVLVYHNWLSKRKPESRSVITSVDDNTAHLFGAFGVSPAMSLEKPKLMPRSHDRWRSKCLGKLVILDLVNYTRSRKVCYHFDKSGATKCFFITTTPSDVD